MGAKARQSADLLDLARAQGFRVERCRNGYKVYGKTVEDGLVTVHLTCSDNRSFGNMIAQLRRIGVRIERQR